MSGVSSWRGLIVPFIFTLIGLVVLVGLGTWQMQRKTWKANLIETVNQRLTSEPISFEDVLKKSQTGMDIRYQPVVLNGTFDHDRERHYFLPYKQKVGWHILTPFRLVSGEVIFVDRGFVPDALKSQKTRPEGLPQGLIRLEGLVRLFEKPGLFTPENDIANNKWYWRDGGALYKSLGSHSVSALDFMIDVKSSAQVGAWPKAGVTRVVFSDKHLGYALTWYGLALTLIGVFIAFAISGLRQTK